MTSKTKKITILSVLLDIPKYTPKYNARKRERDIDGEKKSKVAITESPRKVPVNALEFSKGRNPGPV